MIYILIFILIGGSFLIWLLRKFLFNKNNKENSFDFSLLPYAKIEDNLIHIKNIRNFNYKTLEDYEENYYDKTFDLRKIKRMDYIVEPFSKFRGVAHTFLSFEFEEDNFLAVSVEVPKRKGEHFSIFQSFFRKYKIVYILGDEKDLIKRRSNYENNPVYIYPIKAQTEKIKNIFLEIIKRVNKVKNKPETYNVFSNTCTTHIFKHINEVFSIKIPINLSILLPRNSAWVLYKLGLIDTTFSYEKIKEKSLINEKAQKYANDGHFSLKIRR